MWRRGGGEGEVEGEQAPGRGEGWGEGREVRRRALRRGRGRGGDGVRPGLWGGRVSKMPLPAGRAVLQPVDLLPLRVSALVRRSRQARRTTHIVRLARRLRAEGAAALRSILLRATRRQREETRRRSGLQMSVVRRRSTRLLGRAGRGGLGEVQRRASDGARAAAHVLQTGRESGRRRGGPVYQLVQAGNRLRKLGVFVFELGAVAAQAGRSVLQHGARGGSAEGDRSGGAEVGRSLRIVVGGHRLVGGGVEVELAGKTARQAGDVFVDAAVVFRAAEVKERAPAGGQGASAGFKVDEVVCGVFFSVR